MVCLSLELCHKGTNFGGTNFGPLRLFDTVILLLKCFFHIEILQPTKSFHRQTASNGFERGKEKTSTYINNIKNGVGSYADEIKNKVKVPNIPSLPNVRMPKFGGRRRKRGEEKS
jgi:hypothetical protein